MKNHLNVLYVDVVSKLLKEISQFSQKQDLHEIMLEERMKKAIGEKAEEHFEERE